MTTPETRIGGAYDIIELLGSGAMGRVYRAHDDRLDIDVAVKTSGRLQSGRGVGVDRSERFRREALAMAKLTHPNILQLIAFGVDPRHGQYLATEHVSGGTLETLIDAPERETHLTLAVIADFVAQVADGMAHAHSKSIVHRDLKPGNLLLLPDPKRASGFRLKIADFGVAAVGREHVNHKLTLQGTVIGTPEYMSPEQANGEAVGEKADVYSLGMLIYEMVTGSPPFTGNMMQVVLSHISTPAPDLPLDSETFGPLLALYRSMVSKKPEDRPSMSQVRDTLLQLYPPQSSALGPRVFRAAMALGAITAAAAAVVYLTA